MATTTCKHLSGLDGKTPSVLVYTTPGPDLDPMSPPPSARSGPSPTQRGPQSAQEQTNCGNIVPAFLAVGRYVERAHLWAFLPRLGPPAPARGPIFSRPIRSTHRAPRRGSCAETDAIGPRESSIHSPLAGATAMDLGSHEQATTISRKHVSGSHVNEHRAGCLECRSRR
jgi:hypothetical protein